MKLYESIQRAEDGGHPVPNGEGFGHGEPVFVVKKRELFELLAGIHPMLVGYAKSIQDKFSLEEFMAFAEAEKTILAVLAENQFVSPLRKLGTPREDE